MATARIDLDFLFISITFYKFRVLYHLLITDKRISINKMLVGEGKAELTTKTALKKENKHIPLVSMFNDLSKKTF
jgi:hypothetical protein